eukprot:TRINITY_DN11503_c0_g1_i3.p1 TRINITY_DN11503_c0_g1~~TRINITY_DN11503_c0_g1_i3.p1  ORF type:complete len:478 (+),score=48.23 TRINITY_DN11503_c0_g1_i3:94-1527(+)
MGLGNGHWLTTPEHKADGRLYKLWWTILIAIGTGIGSAIHLFWETDPRNLPICPNEFEQFKHILNTLLWFEVVYFGFGFAFFVEIGRMVRSAMGPLRKQLYIIWAAMSIFAMTWLIHIKLHIAYCGFIMFATINAIFHLMTSGIGILLCRFVFAIIKNSSPSYRQSTVFTKRKKIITIVITVLVSVPSFTIGIVYGGFYFAPAPVEACGPLPAECFELLQSGSPCPPANGTALVLEPCTTPLPAKVPRIFEGCPSISDVDNLCMYCGPWLGAPALEAPACYTGPDKGQMPWDHKSVTVFYVDNVVLFFDAVLLGLSVAIFYVLAPVFHDIYSSGGWKALRKPLLLFIAITVLTATWFPHVILHDALPKPMPAEVWLAMETGFHWPLLVSLIYVSYVVYDIVLLSYHYSKVERSLVEGGAMIVHSQSDSQMTTAEETAFGRSSYAQATPDKPKRFAFGHLQTAIKNLLQQHENTSICT